MFNLHVLNEKNKRQLIDWMMINNLIDQTKICELCKDELILKPTKRNRDELGW